MRFDIKQRVLCRVGSLLATLLISIACAVPVYAVDPPDSTPTLSNIRANRNLLDEDDALIYGEYYIPYATPPDEPADETYLFRLRDGSGDIGAVLPYVKFDKGYNRGVFAFYLPEGNWGETPPTYTIRIAQNPAYFSPPSTWDIAISSTAYTEETEREENQTELAINVITMAQHLESYYDDVTLLQDSPGGTVLSSPAGETYFRGAIYGIQAMAPSLFLVQVLPLDTTPRDWTTDQFDYYRNRYAGTWVETETDTLTDFWGFSGPALMALVFTFVVAIGAVILTSLKYRRTDAGVIIAVVAMTCTAIMGWFPPALFATILQLMALYIAYVWFSSRPHSFMSFYAFIWFASVLICQVIEGSSLGAQDNLIINLLTGFNALAIGDIAAIPAIVGLFFQGLIKILLWDYSFYTGGYVFLKYLWMVTLDTPVVWQLLINFAPVVANFLRFGW